MEYNISKFGLDKYRISPKLIYQTGVIPVEKEVLNLEEASALLGVSSKTLLKMLREEEVPARKIGREWRFSRSALLEWLAGGNSQEYVTAEKVVREYFDRLAPEYDATRVKCYGSDLRNLVLDKVRVDKKMVVADIGCGTGYLTRGLAKKAKTVVAVDNSPEMLSIAQRGIREKEENVRFLLGEAGRLPLAADSIDLLFANMLLHHLIDPGEALREFARVLKPGGGVVITDVEEHPHQWLKKEKSDIWLGFDREELAEWLQESGFIAVEVAELGCDCCTTSGSGREARIKSLIATGRKPEQKTNA